MPDIENEKNWYYKHLIEYTGERQHVLIQLRYQLAFVTIVIITGIWTVLGTAYSPAITRISQNIYSQTLVGTNQNFDIVFFLSFGWCLTVTVIGIWRYFTHVVDKEANSLGVSSLVYTNFLGVLEPPFSDIEKHLNLDNNEYYNSVIAPLNQEEQNKTRLFVMTKLQDHIPDGGILFFDQMSFYIIVISWIILTIANFVFLNLTNSFFLICGITCAIMVLFGIVVCYVKSWMMPIWCTNDIIDKAIIEMKNKELRSQ